MKGRHWSIIAILVLLNYLIFSQLIVLFVESNKPAPTPTRTPKPTFTFTFTPSPLPPTPPTPTPPPPPTPTSTRVVPPTDTPTPEGGPTSAPPPEATAMPVPVETRTGRTTHVVRPGENLSQIAARYGVSVEAIVQANGLEDPSLIYTGQTLIIPAPGEVLPTATPRPPTATPQPAAPTAAPPTATGVSPTATPVPTTPPSGSQYQYRLGRGVTCTPNCGTTGVKGVVYDVGANYVSGLIVKVWTDGWCCGEDETSSYAPYEITLFPGAKGGHWFVAVYSHDGSTQLSDVVEVYTDFEPCEPSSSGCQWPVVDFVAKW
jgi:LysM repeat protein